MCQFCDACAKSNSGQNAIHGTNDVDLLIGNSLANSIFGQAGDDSLSGHAGDDSLYGNAGNDSVLGGLGNDYLVGDRFSNVTPDPENSDDTLRGGLGNDEIHGDLGDDHLFGGHDQDALWGGVGQDWLHGGLGDDYLNGDEDNDRLFGNAGNDTLYGGDSVFAGEDRDFLQGGDGQDLLVGGRDNDTLVGGNQADQFAFFGSIFGSSSFAEANLGIDKIKDFGNGDDKILLDKRVFSNLTSDAYGDFVDSEFTVVNSNAAAMTAEELIVYNSNSGNLFYNENGSENGFGDGGQFAVLQGAPELTAADLMAV